MKEPVINVKRSNKLIDKYKEEYEKDFVKKEPTCEIIYEKGLHKNKTEVIKDNLEKQRVELEEKLGKTLTGILDELKEKVKTPEEIAEYEKIKAILEKKDLQ